MSPSIHAFVDGNGQPEALLLCAGEAADCTAAEALPVDIEAVNALIADKAYDTDAILDHLADVGATAVVPSEINCAEPRMLEPE